MRIIFARHGQSQANLIQEISNRGLRHPLTRQGRQQALELARLLQDEGITRLYTSPLLRAIETSVILAQRLEVDYEVTGALREFDCGIAEGRSDPQAWELWRWAVDQWREAQRYDQCIEGGESFDVMRVRFTSFIDGLVEQYGESQATLLCIGHGGLYMMMLPLVVTNLDTGRILQLKLEYTTRLVCELHPQGLVCVSWNGAPLAGGSPASGAKSDR